MRFALILAIAMLLTRAQSLSTQVRGSQRAGA